jgi:hypothetical protein
MIHGNRPALKPMGTINIEDEEKKQLLKEIMNNSFFEKEISFLNHNNKKQ